MKIDFSPIITIVEVGALKIVAALTVFMLFYALVFLLMKRRVDKRLALLAAQAIGGFGAVGALYIAFVVFAH